jgi:flavodoxin/Pyruvate/2-oxoacid:ferredoxin oxidoreductase delta subunit
MRAIVVYYSGSGNTRKAATAIYQGIKKIIGCDIASVKDVDPKEMGKYDLIGFGSPIWFFREVAVVRQFIYNLPDMKGKLAFMFCSHGGTPASIFHSMTPTIQRKGLTIIGWHDTYGAPHYTLHMALPSGCDGHPDAIDLLAARNFGQELAKTAVRIAAGERNLIPAIPTGPQADPLFHPHGRHMYFPGLDLPKRTFNMQKCKYPDCTVCVDNCPAKAINFTTKPPSIKKSCVNCCICDRLCPQEAIIISEEELSRIRTFKRIDMTKCKYPKCTVCIDHCSMNSIDFSVNPPVFKRNCEGDDLCWVICPEGAIEITNLDTTHRAMVNLVHHDDKNDPFRKMMEDAEAAGRFRPLISKDKWGKEGLIMDMQKHPRFDINELMKVDEAD